MSNDGWIEHDGMGCPVPPKTMVNWRIADRSEDDDDMKRPADRLYWGRNAGDGNIIAYRVVPE
jgi:hypothetical protein